MANPSNLGPDYMDDPAPGMTNPTPTEAIDIMKPIPGFNDGVLSTGDLGGVANINTIPGQ